SKVVLKSIDVEFKLGELLELELKILVLNIYDLCEIRAFENRTTARHLDGCVVFVRAQLFLHNDQKGTLDFFLRGKNIVGPLGIVHELKDGAFHLVEDLLVSAPLDLRIIDVNGTV